MGKPTGRQADRLAPHRPGLFLAYCRNYHCFETPQSQLFHRPVHSHMIADGHGGAAVTVEEKEPTAMYAASFEQLITSEGQPGIRVVTNTLVAPPPFFRFANPSSRITLTPPITPPFLPPSRPIDLSVPRSFNRVRHILVVAIEIHDSSSSRRINTLALTTRIACTTKHASCASSATNTFLAPTHPRSESNPRQDLYV